MNFDHGQTSRPPLALIMQIRNCVLGEGKIWRATAVCLQEDRAQPGSRMLLINALMDRQKSFPTNHYSLLNERWRLRAVWGSKGKVDESLWKKKKPSLFTSLNLPGQRNIIKRHQREQWRDSHLSQTNRVFVYSCSLYLLNRRKIKSNKQTRTSSVYFSSIQLPTELTATSALD